MLGFLEEVVGEPAFVAGNSLGGFIAAHLAAKHPHAVRGLALMNATPFWAFREPAVNNAAAAAAAAKEKTAQGGRRGSAVEDGGTGDWLGWDGTLPAPAGLFSFGAWYFDRMRDPRTVKTMLSAVYSNPGKSFFAAKSRCSFLGPGFFVEEVSVSYCTGSCRKMCPPRRPQATTWTPVNGGSFLSSVLPSFISFRGVCVQQYVVYSPEPKRRGGNI